MPDSGSRGLSLVPPETKPEHRSGGGGPLRVETGLADVVTLERRRAAAIGERDEQAFFLDTVAEYQWARDIAGLAAHSLENLVRPVIEVCEHYGVPAWRLTPREVDRYFASTGKRARSTLRQKVNAIDAYFAFLEQRYAGEIGRRFGVAVESPIDPFNRPRHRGEFGLRIPPSRRAMRAFFADWRAGLAGERKTAVAYRDYAMAKIAYCSGVRASELCRVRIGEVYWDHGQWGRFLVHGKGSRGSGPRDREAYLFAEGRELLWWYVEETAATTPPPKTSWPPWNTWPPPHPPPPSKTPPTPGYRPPPDHPHHPADPLPAKASPHAGTARTPTRSLTSPGRVTPGL